MTITYGSICSGDILSGDISIRIVAPEYDLAARKAKEIFEGKTETQLGFSAALITAERESEVEAVVWGS